MATHTLTEVRRRLATLVDLALAGEDVVISRRGVPLVRLVIQGSDEVVLQPLSLEDGSAHD